MKKEKEINILDVAKESGVSPTTVSRVINNTGTVKETNRKKVEEAVKKLQFKPNPNAQRLASGKNNTIGLVIPKFDNIFSSFFVSEILRGVGEAVNSFQLDLLLHVNTSKNAKEKSEKNLNIPYLAGILFADIYGNREQVELVVNKQIPCVVINNFLEDIETCSVCIDNRKSAYDVTKYLISLGHKKIATICGDMNSQSGQQRLKGYKEAIEEAGIGIKQEYIVPGDYKKDTARTSMETLLSLYEKPTAIFFASDEMAIEGIEVAIENGLDIPEDISVVGFDNSPLCFYSPIPLTTVDQPLFEMGFQAVELLKENISQNKNFYKKVVLPTKIIERKSTKSIN